MFGAPDQIDRRTTTMAICSGLTDNLQKEVKYLRPETIFETTEYARDNEYKIDSDKRTRKFGGHLAPITKTLGLSARQENRGVEAKTKRPGLQKPTPQRKFWKKLTPAEITDRRSNGLCFNCNDLYTSSHVCSPVIFYIMPVADGNSREDEWLEEDELEISLNAINGEQIE